MVSCGAGIFTCRTLVSQSDLYGVRGDDEAVLLHHISIFILFSSAVQHTYVSGGCCRTPVSGVPQMCVFRYEDTEWLSDVQLDIFESSDDESRGEVFSSDNEEFEFIEVDLSEYGFVKLLEPHKALASCWLRVLFSFL